MNTKNSIIDWLGLLIFLAFTNIEVSFVAYSELIKDFEHIRNYMREFYVYGFKTRADYDAKSARSCTICIVILQTFWIFMKTFWIFMKKCL